jgi:hypothetical protein
MDHACSVPPDGPRAECTVDTECSSPTPRCAADLQCVECVDAADCPTSEPACDATSHQCRACAIDADCASDVCDQSSGLCVPESTVLYATPNGTSVASCSQLDRCSIQRAFVISDATRHTIRLAAGIYAGNLIVANKAIVVRGPGATISATTGDTLSVNDAGSLEVSGAVITNPSTNGAAVTCKSLNSVDTPRLTLSDVQVDGTHYGVSIAQCIAKLTHVSVQTTGGNASLFVVGGSSADVVQSSIRGDGTSGAFIISADNSIVRVTNSIVIGTAPNESAQIVALGGCIVFSFSTITNSTATSVQSPAICGGPTANGVCIENSIVANFAPGAPANTVTGAGSIAGYSITFPQQAPLAGPGNLKSNPMFTSPGTGDYHLKAGSPAIDAADPNATLMIDYSGKTRPQGAARDLGAFEYP